MDGMRERLLAYWRGHEPTIIAEDAVFHDLSSGQDFAGQERIAGMLHWFYQVALDARAEPERAIVDESAGRAAVEGLVVGRHTGEFAGVPATGREIRVPICVTYRLQEDRIVEAWVYFQVAVFLQQVGASGGPGQ